MTPQEMAVEIRSKFKTKEDTLTAIQCILDSEFIDYITYETLDYTDLQSYESTPFETYWETVKQFVYDVD